MSDIENLRKIFNETLNGFLNKCIPLENSDSIIYFLSGTSQLYGFDRKKNSFFEPNSINKFKLVAKCIDSYFTDQVKLSFEKEMMVNFDSLKELFLKVNYREKYIGKKFFYDSDKNVIYVWNMVNSKWELIDDINKFKYIFSNTDDLQDNTKVFKSNKVSSFEDLGIDFEDLKEIQARFRDNSIHYLHKIKNKIYSLSIIGNFWYIPDELIQKKILKYVAEQDTISDSDSNSNSDNNNNSDSDIDSDSKTKTKSKSKSKTKKQHLDQDLDKNI